MAPEADCWLRGGRTNWKRWTWVLAMSSLIDRSGIEGTMPDINLWPKCGSDIAVVARGMRPAPVCLPNRLNPRLDN